MPCKRKLRLYVEVYSKTHAAKDVTEWGFETCVTLQ